MSEKDSNTNSWVRRQKDAPAPSYVEPLNRQAQPEKSTQKPLLDHATPQESLTEEQLQPLSKREKPQPSENVFPSPLPSQKSATGAQEYAQFRASTLTPSTDPMLRHAVRTGQKADWKYTSFENVTPAPKKNAEQADEKPVKRNNEPVPAAVVKMPVDKKPFILGAIAIFLALIIILGVVFGIRPKSPGGELGPALDADDTPTILPNQTVTTQTVLTDRPSSQFNNILSPVDPDDPEAKESFSYDYAGNSIVGTSFKNVGTVDKIVKPVAEMKNEGLPNYPAYGKSLNSVLGSGEDKVAARNKLIKESVYVASSNTSHNSGASPHPYNKIDAEGKLWYFNNNTTTASVDDEGNQRVLYAHTASNGLYGGNVSDTEPRIIKEVTMRPRSYNSYYCVTGLYAPAGEVIKIEISDKDMTNTGGLTIHIGQALYNGQANNIWTAKNQMNRFPVILNTMVINKNTATKDEATGNWVGYVGSFLGGPLYIRGTSAKFTATISGCVTYSHFILGYTTKAEFEENKKSTAPYFDLEVWDKGVLHSGPKSQAQKYSYEDLYKAAVLWDKVATVTTYNSNQGIVFIYDPFVAAGAAVAFPGRRSVNCPTGWMSSSLNYNGIVSSGSWGNFHEYHHNFQNYGLGSGADGEVTNNGLNLVSYALFTKITSKRGIGSFGAQGVGGGWNNYTCAPWALQQVKAGSITSTNGLAIYATLLHNFGADAYTRARGSSGKNNYLNKWATVTHHDFTYYASLIGAYGGGNYTPSDAVKKANYPMFVPVSSVYQTGRSYLYDGEKKYFTTMQPYMIPAHQEFNIDLSPYSAPSGQYASGSIVIPDGFEYKIKSITQPSNGKIELVDNYNFKYTPDPNNKSNRSGQIVVTLEINKKDNAFDVEDTDLILEFEQSYEMNKMTLERTTYTYTAETMYSDAITAYNAGFAGSTNGGLKQDQFNPTQNVNTDIWFYPDTEENRKKYPNAPDKYFFHENNIEVIDGKLYFTEDSTYRVYLRGRNNCALYYSLDGKQYSLGAKINESTPAAPGGKSHLFRPNAAETYFDVKFDEGNVYIKNGADPNFPSTPVYKIAPNSNKEIENWLYIREVLIVDPIVARSYIGVGMRQWTQTMFTMAETYHKADNTAIDSSDAADCAYIKTTYNDYNGNAVAYSRRDILRDSDGNKIGESATQYFKKSGNSFVASTEKEVSELTESKMLEPTVTENSQPYVNAYRANYQFPDNSGFESDYFYVRGYNYNYTDNYKLNANQTLVTEQCKYTSPPTSWGWGSFPIGNVVDGNKNTFIHTRAAVSESSPLVLVFDMGEVKSVNRMSIFSQNRPNGDFKVAKSFTLEGSLDGVDYFEVGNFVDVPRNGSTVTVDFEEKEFRYYKLTVTKSYDNHIIIGEIEMWHAFEIIGNGANQVAPDNASLIFSGNWQSKSLQATFGYGFLGESGSKVKFEMIGTRLAILTSTLYDGEYEVYIDGTKCTSIEVKKVNDDYGVTYISQKLESGKHKVEIRCKGAVCFDSFAIYDEK
ncbi:MAG: M60 family metallopeptidase [Clostridia bacterium]|nr:M60 family metallopeptidase [Clostridia bacterium]